MTPVDTTAPPLENIETIRRAYRAFNAADLDAVLALSTDNVEFDWSRSVGPYAGLYTGEQAVRRAYAGFLEAVDELRFEMDEATEIGPYVLVLVSAHIRGRGSGVEVVARGPHLWELRDGKICRFILFQDEADARAAAAGA